MTDQEKIAEVLTEYCNPKLIHSNLTVEQIADKILEVVGESHISKEEFNKRQEGFYDYKVIEEPLILDCGSCSCSDHVDFDELEMLMLKHKEKFRDKKVMIMLKILEQAKIKGVSRNG